MPQNPLYFVDAFSSIAFRGNPAAVCILNDGRDDCEWMQQVAAEVNLSETAFVNPDTGHLRWFTPKVEVDLCGHATLATAFAMMEHGLSRVGETIEFQTRSGQLEARLIDPSTVELDFPAISSELIDSPGSLRRIFSNAIEFHRSKFDLLVRLPSETCVQNFQPDFEELGKLDYRGIMITATPDQSSHFDFVSRFFAPAVGVDEDPVTGSAHCCLATYWGKQLSTNRLKAIQLSKRGGEIEMIWQGERVKLIGNAVLVIKGVLVPNAHP